MLQPLALRDSRDLNAALSAAIQEKAGALLVLREGTFNQLRHDIVRFAAAHRLPAVYGGPYFIEAGGLLVYAANVLDMIRRTGGYVDKILKGLLGASAMRPVSIA